MSVKKRILIFLALTFAITYAYEIFILWPAVVTGSISELAIAAVMLVPAAGTVMTRLLTKEGFGDMMLAPRFKKNKGLYAAAWLLPAAMCFVGAAIYFMCVPGMFDKNLTYIIAQRAAQGIDITKSQALTAAIGELAVGLVLAPILNFVMCLGEELGWRGYLLPKLMNKFKILPSILISGVIWGLWHAPLTLIGHNYGTGYAGYPYAGIAAMCVFCTFVGSVLTFFTVKSKSVIPAVIVHSVINGISAGGLLFMRSPELSNPFVGPMPIGILGGAGIIISGVAMTLVLMRDEKLRKGQTEERSVG